MLHIGGVVSRKESGYMRVEVELLGEGLDLAVLATLDVFQHTWASVSAWSDNYCMQLHLPR